MLVRDVVEFLERIAPRRLAESWDNVGLLVGDPSAVVERVVTCLTLTSDVADEVRAARAQLVVTHHPVLFKPVQRLTTAEPAERVLLQLIAAGVAIHSPHTAYDNARAGINQQLADLLELRDVQPIKRSAGSGQMKVIVYVPQPYLEAVQQALWDEGAGRIGNYIKCSFYHPGRGTFEGTAGAHPAIGQVGKFEQVDEYRLEVICPPALVHSVLARLRAVHPYEEPAFELVPLAAELRHDGAGRWGLLPEPVPLDVLAQRIAARLHAPATQVVGRGDLLVHRLAIACGAAAGFLRDARQEGCEAFLTGEARFHDALQARETGIGLILAGHYATERPGVEQLARLIQAEFADLDVWPSRVETDPLRGVI